MKNKFFHNLFNLLKPYWTSQEKWRAFRLLLLILVCGIVEVRTAVLMNTWQRDFYNALQAFNKIMLVKEIIKFLFLFVILFLSFGYTRYFNGVLSNNWQRWMTQHFLEKWFDQYQTAYAMQLLRKNIDNPDQRISEDLRDFPVATISIFSGLFNTTLSFISFSFILWNLSGPLKFMLNRYHIVIPGYMLWAALFYAVIGTWITTRIGRKLSKLNYEQQQFNADFRFNLIRARESVEQIAMYKGEVAEKNHLKHSFQFIFGNYMRIIAVEKYLSFFTNAYQSLSFFVGMFIALPKYFSERLPLGSLMQINGAFGAVASSLSYIINAYPMIAQWRSVIRRLTEFTKALDESKQIIDQKNIRLETNPMNVLVIDNLDLQLPNGRFLLKQFNLMAHAGERILITGNSGVGKSTLLRAVAGIWLFGTGKISVPQSSKKLFLPQKIYLPQGTLRKLLAYPHTPDEFTDKQFMNALAQCEMHKLIPELDQIRHWSHELSLGEQQMLALARVFLQKPTLLFLDEATSALDEATEVKLYQKIFTTIPSAMIISISHRSNLKYFYSREIHLDEKHKMLLNEDVISADVISL